MLDVFEKSSNNSARQDWLHQPEGKQAVLAKELDRITGLTGTTPLAFTTKNFCVFHAQPLASSMFFPLDLQQRVN